MASKLHVAADVNLSLIHVSPEASRKASPVQNGTDPAPEALRRERSLTLTRTVALFLDALETEGVMTVITRIGQSCQGDPAR